MTPRVHTTIASALCGLALSVLPTAAVGQLSFEERVDSLAAAKIAAGPLAGIQIGVARGGKVIFARGYGMASIELNVPATTRTVYRIGSVTKQFTAAAIMQLVEQGKVSLDDEITKYIPGFPTQGHKVTVHHLLTHTSGIKSYTSLPSWEKQQLLDLTHDELLALIANEPFDFAPGEQWRYNNTGYYLLGMIVEKASGQPFDEYLEQHIFRPAGMPSSSYCHERSIVPNRAQGYEAKDGELVNDGHISMNTPGGAGALCSTVTDLIRWTDALSKHRVVSAESYRTMTTPASFGDGQTTLGRPGQRGGDVSYGYGLMLSKVDGHRRVAHGGGINGFRTQLAHYPDDDLVVAVLINSGGNPGEIEALVAKWALAARDAIP
ncbi:MAG: serine hydrolase domain-containing protein [Gemmatimonadales bacterium]